MKARVIYESFYGNTEKIARAIADELAATCEVTILNVKSGATPDLHGVDLLIIGCPIIQFKPSAGMGAYLASLTPDMVKGLHFACFDTRVHAPKFLTGDAGLTIKKQLEGMGAVAIVEPGRFYVRGKEGPLDVNEIEHAARWAKELAVELAARQ